MLGKMSVKVKIFAPLALSALLCFAPAFAVVPYQPYNVQSAAAGGQRYGAPSPAPAPAVYNPQYIQVNQIARMPQAAPVGRITGGLPKVGNAYVNAGRKYYQPEGFDRLADSGLYIGLSVGYTYS
ncbi:MAG: hypothetical protein LBQ49_03270, partial [Rickettsiales bacterium]|nr:hypothetical protein [Rickettsiales bacterium]